MNSKRKTPWVNGPEQQQDEAASEIIKESIDKYIDSEIIKETEKETAEQEEYWSKIIEGVVNKAMKGG